MADVRALLKAKRQEARITHPYASYTAAGQLRCTVCSAPVKHASAWEGHLGSKAHRTNVVRRREEENQRLQKEREQAAPDGGDDDDANEDEDADDVSEEEEQRHAQLAPGKRRAPAGGADAETRNPGPAEKKRKVEGGSSSSSAGFPQDFFSDPSRGPITLPDDDEDLDGEGEAGADASKAQAAGGPAAAPMSEIDLEYERFQRELLETTAATAAASMSDKKEAFQRATVYAEAVQASTHIDGFPPVDAVEAEVAAPELTEDEIRQKKALEERELIMDRLLEEERAQEDADTKVQMLKNRVEALRKKREQAKAKKAAAPPPKTS